MPEIDNNDNDNTQSFVPLVKGTEVGHYKIIDKIGAGGMGEVYLAEDTELKREVAIKFLPAHLCGDEDYRARFVREARAVAALSHPNIVTIFEVGEFKERPFFAMECVKGETLKDVIKKDKLTINEAINYAMQICEGLHKAHESGIVHRDIKPGNIIIDSDNRARILDFGLAMVTGEEKLTKTGSTLGTVGYMSPEQIEGVRVDHRSDLFSVGVILYEMLTGRRPFEGDNDAAVIKAITDSTAEPIARFKSGVTGELQSVIDKALSKDVSIRYQTASGMQADLKRFGTDFTPAKKSRVSLWVALAAVVVIAGGFLGYMQFFGEKAKPDGPKRLVVLPFDNVGDQERDYFAEGMTQEIITKLSSLDNIKVIAKQSAAKLKAKGLDVSDIGKELGVEYVLDATVQWQESNSGSSRVKLITQLIKVSDESVFWGKTYDTMVSEIFAIQSDMAEKVAEQLGVVLSSQEKQQIWQKYTNSQEAWDYYLRGNKYRERGYYGTKEDMELAISMYWKAIEIDSTFARAYSQISRSFSRLYVTHHDRSDSCRIISKETAERALEQDTLRPGVSRGRRALGYYYSRFEKDWEKALKEWEIAYGGKEKASSNPWFLWDAHIVKRKMGLWEETYRDMKKVVEAEPKQENAWYDLANVCWTLRKYEEAERYFQEAILLEPDWWWPTSNLSDLYLNWQGNTEKARKVLSEIRNMVDTSIHPSNLYLFKLDLIDGDMESARERLNKLEPEDIGLFYWAKGDSDSARKFYDSSVSDFSEQLKSDSGMFGEHLLKQGLNYARLENSDSAMHFIQTAMDLRPYSLDKYFGTYALIVRFIALVILGELDSALVQADMLLSVPTDFDLGLLLIDPDYKELIKYPGFADLLRKYGNEYHKRLFEEKVGPL